LLASSCADDGSCDDSVTCNEGVWLAEEISDMPQLEFLIYVPDRKTEEHYDSWEVRQMFDIDPYDMAYNSVITAAENVLKKHPAARITLPPKRTRKA